MKVAVFGLGKLGLPLAAVFANAGHEVIGVDKQQATIDALNRAEVLIEEPDLPAMVAANAERISATADAAEAVAAAEMSFVIVPTPSGPDGAFINDYVVTVLSEIGAALRANPREHLIAVTSTVMPGATGEVLAPALEEALGRPLGDDVHLCYSPEFIALGSVVRDLMHPDMILIGANDRLAGERLGTFYRSVSGEEVPTQVMAWANAELAKIAVNTFVTTKISFANMLAEICESLPEGDVDAVTSALGLDSRIGPKYLKGGPPYGGPCFPRDNRALSTFANSIGARSDIASATDAINDAIPIRIVHAVLRVAEPPAKIAVLGLAYKENTPVVEESTGGKVVAALIEHGFVVSGYDPLASLAVLNDSAAGIECANALEAVAEAAVVVLTAQNDAYTNAIKQLPSTTTVIDCWRTIANEDTAASVVRLGRSRG